MIIPHLKSFPHSREVSPATCRLEIQIDLIKAGVVKHQTAVLIRITITVGSVYVSAALTTQTGGPG